MTNSVKWKKKYSKNNKNDRTRVREGEGYNILGRPAVCDINHSTRIFTVIWDGTQKPKQQQRQQHNNVCALCIIDMCSVYVRIKKANGIHCNNPRTSDEVSDNK